MMRGKIRLARSLGIVVAIVGACALGAQGAGAVIIKLPNGHVISYFPTRAKFAALPPTKSDNVFTNLDYNGGPVMPSSKDYLIFWAPSGTTPYPTEYASGLATYWTDLAHDSGGNQNTDSVSSQYNDSYGNLASYKVSYGGAFTDTDPYPANGCNPAAYTSGTVCLIDTQLQTELQSFVTANHLPENLSTEYFLVFPPGVANCFDTNPNDGCSVDGIVPTYQAYCAYHSNTPYTPGNPVIIYSNDPYVSDVAGCQNGSSYWPNGPSDGALAGGMSHEHIESITDPIPNTAWTDFTTGPSNGYEIGDKCGNSNGPVLGGDGSTVPFYNQVINGDHYYYQEEWSNQGHQCLQRLTYTSPWPNAVFSSSPGSGLTMNFDGTGSFAPGGVSQFHWEFESTVTTVSESESASPTTSHTYSASGLHTVSLTTYGSNGTSWGTSRVIRTGQTGPTASFTVSSTTPASGTGVTFNGSGSSAESGQSISTYSWVYGDGSTATGATPAAHTYTANGIYFATLTVTDSLGQTASKTVRIVVGGPTVTTTAATSVGSTTASLNVTINPGGSATTYKYEYGTSTAFGTVVPSSGTLSAGSGTSPVAQPAQPITGLAPGTTYYYRACANNAVNPAAGDQVCGGIQVFTTAGTPTATTQAASSISTSGATLNGQVTPAGVQTAYTFEWGTSPSFGNITTVASAGAGSSAVPVSAALTGLDDDTTYYYRLVATNANNVTSTGATMTFTTSLASGAPNAHTGQATGITSSGATLHGIVNPKASNTAFTFEYGTTTSFGHIATVDSTPGGFTFDEPVSLPVTGLASHTTYLYRIIAVNSTGTTTGAVMSFTTS